jgi:Subtilase family
VELKKLVSLYIPISLVKNLQTRFICTKEFFMTFFLLRGVRFFKAQFGIFVKFLPVVLIAACGGGGGGDGTSVGGNNSTLLATQIAEVQPDSETDTSSVFVQLGSPNAPTSGAQIATEALRAEIQNQFLVDLEAATTKPKVILGISTSAPCDATGFAQQLENAHKFNTDTTVRLDLTACQLNLLKSMPNVKGVFPDFTLDHQAAPSPSAFNYLNSAIDASFNGTSSRQINTSNTGSGSPKVADGNGVVIALLDTGVEDRHPALGSAKVLPGACFSTASNGGTSFCSSGNTVIEPSQNTDPTKRVARSCADATNSGNPVWSSKQLGINAGCEHGTAMASAAVMGATAASSGTVNTSMKGGIAPQAKILPVQVFNKSGNAISASSGDLLAALEWVASEAQRRKISNLSPIVAINMSLGGGSFSQNCDNDYVGGLFKSVFAKLRILGTLPIVAAGNSGNKSAISFPACASNAVSVAATQLDGNSLASYSNFSNQVKLLAIGGESNPNAQYALPSLCSDGNNFDCWNTMAGTSPATALASGGVAALTSLKPDAALTDIETALTSAVDGGTSKSVALYGTTKPTLRLTSSGYRLIGLAEPNANSSTPAPSPTPSPPTPSPTQPVTATQGKVCFYTNTNYQGKANCALFNYGGSNQWYKLATRIGSVKIEPINGSTPASSAITVTYFHYAFDYKASIGFNTGSGGVSKSIDLPNTSALGFWDRGIPLIYGVNIIVK